MAIVVKRRAAAAAGLEPAGFSGHSLRSGFLTAAANAGASIWKMQEVSRHKSIQVLSTYVRAAELFDQHAGGGFLWDNRAKVKIRQHADLRGASA